MRELAAYQVFETFTSRPAEALARRISDLSPIADAKVFFTPGGGSDAIDTAAKLTRAYWRAVGRPDKQVIVGRSYLITVAKGLTSGYAPLGAVLAGRRVAEPFWRPGSAEIFRHGYTYQAHPTACAVGLANLDILEREQLVVRVRELEGVLAARLAPLADHDLVGEVRTGTGLLTVVEIHPQARQADPGLAARLVAGIRERGVITRLLRGVALQVSPPFVISEQEINRIGETFAAELDAAPARA